LLTLLAGAATAAVLVGLSMNASSHSAQRKADQLTNAAPAPVRSPEASPSPEVSPSPESPPAAPSAPPAAAAPRAYTSRVDGGKATVAIVVNGEKAIAYLCDGSKIEAWLSGKAAGAKLELTGDGGASLSAELGGGKASGSAKAAGRSYTFAAPLAKAPGGLYRVAKRIRGAKIVGGWIVLADGTQVGILTRDGAPTPAPRLDPATGTATAGGDTLTASPVDGTSL
jgi:serine/threonine-protein kinase